MGIEEDIEALRKLSDNVTDIDDNWQFMRFMREELPRKYGIGQQQFDQFYTMMVLDDLLDDTVKWIERVEHDKLPLSEQEMFAYDNSIMLVLVVPVPQESLCLPVR